MNVYVSVQEQFLNLTLKYSEVLLEYSEFSSSVETDFFVRSVTFLLDLPFSPCIHI